MAQYNMFEFRSRTRVMYGVGCLEELPDELQQLDATRVVICTDPGLVKAGVVDMAKDVLQGSPVELVAIFDAIMQDARVGPINAAAKMIRETSADGVVALGGGSVMDSVKSIVHMLGHGRDDFQEILERPIFDFKPLMPHVAIPTTAGTGCEVTLGAMVYNEKEKIKGGFLDIYASSDVALLDPQVTVGLPPAITACTGMDALTHAIEAYTSTMAQPFSDGMSLHEIKKITEFLPKAVANGNDLEARGEMLIASCMAGLGINCAVAGAVHALAHALGGRFGIPHGVANSILLPWVMEANAKGCAGKYRDIARAMGERVDGLSDEEAARRLIERVRELKATLGLTEGLAAHGVTREKIEQTGLVDLAIEDGTFVFNPVSLDHDEVREIYRKAL